MVLLGAIREIARAWTRNPLATTIQLCRTVAGSNVPARNLAEFLGAPIQSLSALIKDADDSGLEAIIRETVRVTGPGLEPSRTLYALCRLVQPEVVVETGVAEGISSSFILKALQGNRRGRLFSVDGADYTENGRDIGYIVPASLRDRWSLRKGWSQLVLPELLEELGEVDMFFHDSDHSYGVVKFELETAYPHVRKGGVLAADDVFQTSAFFDMCRKFGLRPSVMGWRIGLARKTSD